jgi:hypothetical protein
VIVVIVQTAKDIALLDIIRVNYLLTVDEDLWLDYFAKVRKSFDNDCHSVSRSYCYSVPQDMKDEITAALKKTTEAHLFHNAVPCAANIFNYQDGERGRNQLAYLE